MSQLPSDFFPEEYLRLNPDVRAAGVDAATHYIQYGIKEGRQYRAPRYERQEPLPGEAGFRPLPLIVISYNRGEMLRRVIASYRQQTVPLEIVVHDNGSDDVGTLEILDELEGSGIQVFRRARISNADELNLVNETVSSIFARREPSAYIVSDGDVDLDRAESGAIAIYLAMLNMFKDIECVGPMLRIDDIRKNYPLFGRVMNLHIRQFWHKYPEFAQVLDRDVAYIRASIDTTFAVHRSTQPFRRLKSGIRVYAPFDAKHLDWYPDEQSCTGRGVVGDYGRTSSAEISHWSNGQYIKEFSQEPLAYEIFKVVEKTPFGTLEVKTRQIRDNPK